MTRLRSTVAVPAIIGATAKDAKRRIEAKGLKWTFNAGQVALTADQVHRVYQVEPQPGTRVENGKRQ